MTRTTLAVAADYADAMITARRAKNWLFAILLVVILAQITAFFLVKYRVLKLTTPASASEVGTLGTPAAPSTLGTLSVPAPVTPATVPAAADVPAPAADGSATTAPSTITLTTPSATLTAASITLTPPTLPASASVPAMAPLEKDTMGGQMLRYAVPVTEFLGVALAIVLAVVLLLQTNIMVVGRLIGVSYLASAFIWTVVLVTLLFPWQAFLISRVGNLTPGAEASVPTQPAFKVPGVLYTYAELRQDYDFPTTKENWQQAVLKWSRYAVFPALAAIVLAAVHVKSSRGLRMALGEADVQVDVTARPGDAVM